MTSTDSSLSSSSSKTPIALTIAGSDSGGGAGIQADLKTFSALGAYGASVITALTAQNTREVRAILDIPAAFIESQMDAVCDDLSVQAVKIGMLSQPEVISSVANKLRQHALTNVVLDPVMVAKSGDKLLADDAVAHLREHLLPLATLITPNLPEAAVLLSCPEPHDEATMLEAANGLQRLGARAVLLKGGHLKGSSSADLLLDDQGKAHWLASTRIDTPNTHGTGCTLSSAIAAYLAQGVSLFEATERAKQYIQAAIGASDQLAIGHGHGPVHHFHHWWSA